MLEGNIREYEEKRLAIEAAAVDEAIREEPACAKDPNDLMFSTEVDVPARAYTQMAHHDIPIEQMLDKEHEERPTMLKQFETDTSFREILDKIVNKT